MIMVNIVGYAVIRKESTHETLGIIQWVHTNYQFIFIISKAL